MLSQGNISSAGNCERRNAIPVIYTSGTYYEVGFDVGRTFRGLIQDYLASSVWLRETLLPAYETEAGRAAYDETLPVLKENFPQYLRELQGTADGAQVPFLHRLRVKSCLSPAGPPTHGQDHDHGGPGGAAAVQQ